MERAKKECAPERNGAHIYVLHVNGHEEVTVPSPWRYGCQESPIEYTRPPR